MKFLYMGDPSDDTSTISKLIKVHFHKIDLYVEKSRERAKNLVINDGPFSAFIIDAGMKDENPTEVISEFYDITGHRPTVFVGVRTFIERRISDEVFRSHVANQILYRPYLPDDLIKAINGILSWIEKEEFEQSVIEADFSDFVPMRIKNFYTYSEIPCDAYLEVGQGKFIKLITKNKRYTHSKIVTYAQKGVKHLYLYKEEHLKLMSELQKSLHLKLTRLNTKISKLSPKNIQVFLVLQVKAVSIIHQFLSKIGVTEGVVQLSHTIIDGFAELYDRFSSLDEFLALVPFKEHDTAEHAVLTGYVSLAILKGLSWDSSLSRSKLGLAAIIHNCMMSNDSMIIFNHLKEPDLQTFSKTEQEEFRDHPRKAAQLAHTFNGFSDVDFIVEQHHEHPDGIGFPSALNSFELTPMSAAFIIAGRFSIEYLYHKNEISTAHGILRKLSVVYNIGSFKEVIKSFEKFLKKSEKQIPSNSSSS